MSPRCCGRQLVLLCLILLLSLGASAQIQFFTPPTYSGGTGPDFVADFNGDGKPDILSGGVLILGNGDGTFTKGTAVPGTPLAVADFNGDGKPDLLGQGQGTLEVFLGNGDGTFQTTPIITNIEASLQGVIAGDLRGDGKFDVLGFSNNTVIVYLGNGDGTFAAGVSYPVVIPFGPVVITLGDFNGDQKADVVVSVPGGNVAGQEVVFLGNGDGTLQAGIGSTGVPYPGSVVTGDFNADGKLDLVISNQPSGCTGPCPPTSILLGNGDGTFQAPSTVFPGSGSLAVGDINGDGKLDLVFLDQSEDVEVYLGNGDGTFSNTHTYQTQLGGGNDGPLLADFNLDGKLDIAAAGTTLLGNGNGTFNGWSAVAGAGPISIPSLSLIAIGDFDKNGTQDLAASTSISSNNPDSLYIFTNDGTGALSLAHTYAVQQQVEGIAAADFNGDGNLDLIAVSEDVNSGTWGYSVLLGNGDGSFQSPVFYLQTAVLDGFITTIVFADFNNDHKLDFAVPAGNGTFAVLLGNGDGTFGAPTYFFDGNSNNQAAGALVAADFNGDGKIDIAASDYSNPLGGMAILLGNGDGTFQTVTFPFTDTVGNLFAVDLNHDGKVDLVDSNGHAYLGNGDGTFKEIAASGYSVTALADINGDGVPDEVGSVTKSLGGLLSYTTGVALGNGDGTFGVFQGAMPPSSLGPSTPLAADMNGDGKQDLIVAGGTIFVLINTTGSFPGVSFSPGVVVFPSQAVGTSSGTMPVTLTNTGAVALTVSAIAISGANTSEFSQTNNCSKIQPLANCTISVTFSPSATGTAAASVMISDNAAGSPQSVALTGVAVAAPSIGLVLPSGSSSSATVTAGGTAKYALSIGGAGMGGETSITCTGAPTGAACTVTPSSLNVSATSPSSIAVSVTTLASTNAALSHPRGNIWILGAGAVGFVLLPICRKKRYANYLGVLPLTMLLMLSACGGGGSGSVPPSQGGGTPSGTYPLTVTATPTTGIPQSVKLTLIVQ